MSPAPARGPVSARSPHDAAEVTAQQGRRRPCASRAAPHASVTAAVEQRAAAEAAEAVPLSLLCSLLACPPRMPCNQCASRCSMSPRAALACRMPARTTARPPTRGSCTPATHRYPSIPAPRHNCSRTRRV
eukprot:365025-Chlamydomonas_euryale.AAC.21